MRKAVTLQQDGNMRENKCLLTGLFNESVGVDGGAYS